MLERHFWLNALQLLYLRVLLKSDGKMERDMDRRTWVASAVIVVLDCCGSDLSHKALDVRSSPHLWS